MWTNITFFQKQNKNKSPPPIHPPPHNHRAHRRTPTRHQNPSTFPILPLLVPPQFQKHPSPLSYINHPCICTPPTTLIRPPCICKAVKLKPPKIHSIVKNSQLALTQETQLEDSRNKGVVSALYESLSRRDAEAIVKILAPDLEWWFHGPPSHQFLMRLLSGDHQESSDSFRFVPHSISAFGPTVLAEGFDQTRAIAWVHAWTVSVDGVITQVREYFNTSLIVTRFGNAADPSDIAPIRCPGSVWESSLPNRVGKSVPGLVLAI